MRRAFVPCASQMLVRPPLLASSQEKNAYIRIRTLWVSRLLVFGYYFYKINNIPKKTPLKQKKLKAMFQQFEFWFLPPCFDEWRGRASPEILGLYNTGINIFKNRISQACPFTIGYATCIGFRKEKIQQTKRFELPLLFTF